MQKENVKWLMVFYVNVMYLQVVPATAIPDGWMGLDVGPDAIKSFSEALDTTKTIIWNGPMGVFEFDKFAAGTEVWIVLAISDHTQLLLRIETKKYTFLFAGNCQEACGAQREGSDHNHWRR